MANLFDISSFFKIIFFFLLSLQPSIATTSNEICSVSCGFRYIRFPFHLNNQPYRCGYPRFNLSCRNQRTTIVFPFAGEFIVQNIEYSSQTILVDDPDGCNPGRLLKARHYNFSSTPFVPLKTQNYAILNCSSTAGAPTYLPDASPINCLSGKTFTVVAIPPDRLDMYPFILFSCSKIATVAAPDLEFIFGMRLTWNEPDCTSCENGGGLCMFNNDTGLDIGCFSPPHGSSGVSKSAKYGTAFGVGIPLLCVLGLVFYLRKKGNINNRHQHHPNQEISFQIGLRQLRASQGISIPINPVRLPTISNGLDGPTIQSYPITLVGESRRLPRPNHNTCTICLSEYQAKESLRTIPDCNHYFHASCIDEWLKLNATCPLCRNLTEGSTPAASSSSSL